MNSITRGSFRVVERSLNSQWVPFSTKPPRSTPMFTRPKMMKGLTLLALIGSVGFIYMTAITKMKQTDDLESLIDKETTITNNKRK